MCKRVRFIFFLMLIGFSVVVRLSAMEKNAVIQWGSSAERLYCYLDAKEIVFECGDNTVRKRWNISDRYAPFFSTHGIQKISRNIFYCKNEECISCSALSVDALESISIELQHLREMFLYIPVSALRNEDGSWKKNGNLLLKACVANRWYDVFLQELHSSESCSHYQNALEEFNAKQRGKVSLSCCNTDGWLWLLSVTIPFYTRCSYKERKKIGIFLITNLFFKLCKLR